MWKPQGLLLLEQFDVLFGIIPGCTAHHELMYHEPCETVSGVSCGSESCFLLQFNLCYSLIGTKNLIRCVLLPLMGTVAGILLFYTLPDIFSDWVLNTKLPFWFYDNQVSGEATVLQPD